MNAVNKLVLGTVQFGLNYGINNQAGQVSQSEVKAILKVAHSNGINTLDTSSAYGNSEFILGEAFALDVANFRIVSKYPQSNRCVRDVFNDSLFHLHQSKLYGYLVHHFEYYQSHSKIWDEMCCLRDEGKIEKIGFSLYTVSQLQYLLDRNVAFDILQFPYNILDRQFDPYLRDLKRDGVEIHTRSAFLQGLFFKDVNSLGVKLLPLKSCLENIHDYCEKNELSVEQFTLNYVASNPFIDGVLIGVDSHEQLEANINALQCSIRQKDMAFISSIEIENCELLNPLNWK